MGKGGAVIEAPPGIAIAPQEARALAAIARRQLSWDQRLAARIVTTSTALGIYTVPPLGVLAFVAVPAEAADADAPAADMVVSLAALVTALEAGAVHGAMLDLAALPQVPVPVTSGPSVAFLPPSTDWQLPIHAVSGDLAVRVDAAVEEFERRAKGLGERQQQVVADEIWARTAWAGLPMRTLHAARRLGMLGNDRAKVSAATNGEWRRLSTPRGQVFTRIAARPGLRLVR